MILNFGGKCEIIPEEKIQIETDQDRFFLPGRLHGGDYILQAYAYNNEGVLCVEVACLFPDDILRAAEKTIEEYGYLDQVSFFELIQEDGCVERFICKNEYDDPCIDGFNENWLAYGIERTAEELIAWANLNR